MDLVIKQGAIMMMTNRNNMIFCIIKISLHFSNTRNKLNKAQDNFLSIYKYILKTIPEFGHTVMNKT